MNDYNREIEFAKTLALKAGEIISKNFLHSTITTKTNLTPVTETDLAVSKLVIDEVKKYFPSHAVVVEELQQDNGHTEFQWVCDPVDGTVPFSHHIPACMFSLALCRNEEPVVAVAYDPFLKRMYFTFLNKESYLNNKTIHVNKNKFVPGDYIFGRPYFGKDFDANKYLALLRENKIKDSTVGSLVYEGTRVAAGLSKGMIAIGCSPWDRAAIKMIIENAGGICTDERGERLPVFGSPKYFIASNGTVHKELLDIVQKCI